jgi:ABC-2 type transport system ATP-binding protein
MIELTQYSKSYGDKLIVRIDRMTIPEGISVIRGQNGSGKTTLFRSIAGIIPFKGSIRLFNIDQKKNPVKYRHRVSYGEAMPALPPFLTGKDMLKFFRSVRSASSGDVEEIQETLGINEFINEKIDTYSEGMHKRLSLCLALIGYTPLVILDEPFAFLDTRVQESLKRMISKLRQEKKTNFLISSHTSGANQDLNPTFQFLLENHSLIPSD